MRRMVVEMLALLLVPAVVSTSPGQQSPGAPPGGLPARIPDARQEKLAPAKSKLEEMLAEALKSNPDIRVAIAKLNEADAELNRARLQVTQKVIDLHHAMLSQKAAVEYEQKKFERMKTLAEQGSIDTRLLEEAQQRLTMAKAKLAELEAQLPALLGKAAHGPAHFHSLAFSPDGETLAARLIVDDSNVGTLVWTIKARSVGPLAERLRKALETPVKVDYKDTKLADMLADLQKKAPGLSFRDISGHGQNTRTVQFEETLPVSAVLQAIGDYFEIRFVVREYGILVTSAKAAPPGALTVQEFLHQKPAGK